MMRHHLGYVEGSLDRGRVETVFADAGLQIERVDEIGTEWREYAEEHTSPDGELFERLAEETRAKTTAPQMMVGRIEGQFLATLQTVRYPTGC